MFICRIFKKLMHLLKEIDVVVSNDILSSMYLLQFPNKPNFASLEDEDIINTRFKKPQDKLEIHVGLNPLDSQRYDRTKGETFAKSATDSKTTGHSNFLQSQVYVSSKSGASQGKHFVGSFNSGTLYLIPISHILQMRIGLNYLDQSGVTIDSQLSSFLESESDDPLAKAQQVHVKFASVNKKATLAGGKVGGAKNEAQKASQYETFKSFEYYDKIDSDIPWTALSYQPFDTNHVRELFAKSSEETLSPLPMHDSLINQAKDYEKILLTSLQNKFKASDLGETTPDVTKKLTFIEGWETQLTQLLMKAQVLRFKEVWKYVNSRLIHSDTSLTPKDMSSCKESVTKHLQQIADLVRGCWVIKSNLLYPTANESEECTGTGDYKRNPKANLFSTRGGGPGHKNRSGSKILPIIDRTKLIRQTRDLILTIYDLGVPSTLTSSLDEPHDLELDKFSRELEGEMVIRRDTLSKYSKVGDEELTEILKGVARHKPKVGWIFKYDRDDTFLARELDPDTFQRLGMLTNLRRTHLLKELNVQLKTTNLTLDLLSKEFKYPNPDIVEQSVLELKREGVVETVENTIEVIDSDDNSKLKVLDSIMTENEVCEKLDDIASTSVNDSYFGENSLGDDDSFERSP